MSTHRVSFGHIEIGPTARKFLNEALDRGWVTEGPNVRLFEERFARRFGYGQAVAVSSGTDAGLVAASALFGRGAQRGDEVITPALAFVATANCLLAAGLVPKFVDVELDTLNIDPGLIEAAITPRTRAVQIVHTMGKPCRMGPIMEIARKHGLLVIEDSCEAHGAQLDGQYIGTFGAMALFSFYTAHIICSAEGGMIATADPELASLCRSIRSHGRPTGDNYFSFERTGFNSRMNDLEAAIGLEGLELFDETFEKRRRYLLRLFEALRPLEEHLILYPDGPGEVTCPHAFPLVMRDPRRPVAPLYRYLEARGIQCKTLFGSLPTQHAAFAFLGHREGQFAVSERIGRTGLHFGVHQYLGDNDVEYAAETVRAFFA